MKAYVIVTFLALVGCGYTFQGGGTVLPSDIKKVYVAPIKDSLSEPHLKNLLLEAMKERLERYGVLTVAGKESDADAIFELDIVGLDKNIKSVSSGSDTALEYEMILTLDGELRRASGPLLWKKRDMKVKKSFGITGDVIVTSSSDFSAGGVSSSSLASLGSVEISRGQEREAMVDLAEEVAKKVYEDAVAPDF